MLHPFKFFPFSYRNLQSPNFMVDSNEVYSNFPTVFSVRFNNGGSFTSTPGTVYKDIKVNYFDDVDFDSFSVIELNCNTPQSQCHKPQWFYNMKCSEESQLQLHAIAWLVALNTVH